MPHSGLNYVLQRFYSLMHFRNESVVTEIFLKCIKGKRREKDCFRLCGRDHRLDALPQAPGVLCVNQMGLDFLSCFPAPFQGPSRTEGIFVPVLERSISCSQELTYRPGDSSEWLFDVGVDLSPLDANFTQIL